MSQTEPPRINRLLSLAAIFGAILIFAVVLYVAYLPARPAKVDQQVNETRKQKAAEARAAGLAKINGYEVIDKEAGIVRIPIEKAMESTVMRYNVSEASSN